MFVFGGPATLLHSDDDADIVTEQPRGRFFRPRRLLIIYTEHLGWPKPHLEHLQSRSFHICDCIFPRKT